MNILCTSILRKLRPLAFAGAGIMATAASFSACVPSTSIETNNITMSASPSALSITKPTDTLGSNVALSCGCAFGPVKVISYTGDTSRIHYFTKNFDSVLTAHQIFFVAAPATPSATLFKTAMVIHHLDDHNTDLYDTILTSAQLP